MNIKEILKRIKWDKRRGPQRKVKMKVTYTKPVGGASSKPVRVITINRRILRYITLGLVVAFTIGFGIYSFKLKDTQADKDNFQGNDIAEANSQDNLPVEEQEPEEEVELPVIDLSEYSMALETDLQRINEPIPYSGEILYSAGNSQNIDEPVFQDLYLMNLDTGEEKTIAHTEIKFGEIYEGRFNQDWIAWLDTNQSGENQLYAMDRKTQEISKIKTCEFNKPQLRLAGDNLVWVEQRDVHQDSLYLYNFKSGEPVVLEIFDNPTYGTCPPSISEELLVWVAPNEEDLGNKSIIKVLDISKAISVDLANSSQGDQETGQGASTEDASEVGDVDKAQAGDEGTTESAADTDDVDKDDVDKDDVDKTEVGDEDMVEDDHEDTDVGVAQAGDEGVDPEIIDPEGFAIYPTTNGKAIAWLDNLNPSAANLKLTLDKGRTIIDVAQNVARPYGIGDGFIAYMQEDSVMAYFWELDRYAQLNKPGSKARLTQGGVYGNTVVWYSADDPNQKNDEIFVSTVDKPVEEQLLGSN